MKKDFFKKPRTVVLFLYCFYLTGCQESIPKRKPRLEQKVVNEFVTSHYNPDLDVLFIIDNSPSMRPVQKLLAKNASLFIDEFLDVEFVDYHIAVTSSSLRRDYFPKVQGSYLHEDALEQLERSVYGGRLKRCDKLAENMKYNHSNYVDRNTPEAEKCLSEMINVGITGQDSEYFLNIPPLVFSKEMIQGENSSFYRPGAHLAIFVITDASDHSSVSSYRAYDFLSNLKRGDERKIHYAAGIVAFEALGYECDRDRESVRDGDSVPDSRYFPHKIMKMVEFSGPRGYWFNLCRFNYGKHLAEFAARLVDSVLTIPLDDLPDMNTLEIRYNYKGGSQVVPKGSEGWTYDMENNAIRLSRDIHLSQAGGKFNVKYKSIYTFEPDQGIAF